MTDITEIADNVFRISTYVSAADIQFNQFLVRDDEPLLYHTGHKRLFPDVSAAVARLIDPAQLLWIGFSHMEADECGGLHDWQQLAPHSTALCSIIGKRIGVDDFIAARPARAMADGETLATGRYRFRFLHTPQLPHGWDAGLMFEEEQGVLFCSDLLHQNGNLEALTSEDVVGRFRKTLEDNRNSPVPGYMPYTAQTGETLARLSALEPGVIAAMHGSSYAGDGRRALTDTAAMMREVLDTVSECNSPN